MTKEFAIAIGVLCLLLPRFSAAQENRIYLANDDHTDFMWTADADTYAHVFVEMLDWHLKLADETSQNESAYRHRFNCDGSYWLWNYERNKSPAEFARLLERIKDGTISVPLNTVVSCYGGQAVEAVLRGMYYAGRIERKHNLRFALAVAMENQTLPLGLASLFAGSGAKYSWRGVCGCATRMRTNTLAARHREIYWWTGHDGQCVLLKWHSLVPPGNKQSGGYSEAFDPLAAIRFLDSDEAFLSRYRSPGMVEPYRIRAAFGFGWDALNRKTGEAYQADPQNYPTVAHFHEIAQDQSHSQRQVIVSNEVDFFEDFAQEYGQSLEKQTLTYGNEWDLYSASMSETSARVKRAVEKLRSAELMAALVSLQDREFMQSYTVARDQAFIDLGLYWEHNWTADGPISRAQRGQWQSQLAGEIESFVNTLYEAGRLRLGTLIPPAPEAIRFFVLNPLGWSRTEHADLAYAGPADIRVCEAVTEHNVLHQLVQRGQATYLRILAEDVPPAGYKVYEILPGKKTEASDEAARSGQDGRFENDQVRLVVNRDGSIRSFVDMSRGSIELAASIDGFKLNDFDATSDEGEALRIENSGPVSVTLRARCDVGLKQTTAITLYRDSPRVDIENELLENFGDVRHWAFSFALPDPDVHTEEVGAVNFNKLNSDGGDYADSQARYDYVTVNHFADVTNGSNSKGMTISNPDLAFARLGSSTVAKLDTATPQLHFLAGGQVDGPKLGIPNQNGNTYFLQRFALRPHGAYSPVQAMKFAMEHQNPLTTGCIKTAATQSSASVSYPPTVYSLCEVSHPDVLLQALKVHDDGIASGLVARLWNLAPSSTASTVTFAPELAEAHRTTHLETDLEQVQNVGGNTFSTAFMPQQIQTYRVNLK